MVIWHFLLQSSSLAGQYRLMCLRRSSAKGRLDFPAENMARPLLSLFLRRKPRAPRRKRRFVRRMARHWSRSCRRRRAARRAGAPSSGAQHSAQMRAEEGISTAALAAKAKFPLNIEAELSSLSRTKRHLRYVEDRLLERDQGGNVP